MPPIEDGSVLSTAELRDGTLRDRRLGTVGIDSGSLGSTLGAGALGGGNGTNPGVGKFGVAGGGGFMPRSVGFNPGSG